MILKVEGLRKSFGERTVLQNINLSIVQGDFVAIVGESGVGKSTLLKIFDKEISADSDKTIKFKENYESVLIPQSPALWDNLTVLENVTLVRKLLFGESYNTTTDKATEFLNSVKIGTNLFESYPCTLSGGEKQRVSVARGLATETNVILLDEITSNIDPDNKKIVVRLLNQLHEKGFTLILVTHDHWVVGELKCRILELTKNGLIITNNE